MSKMEKADCSRTFNVAEINSTKNPEEFQKEAIKEVRKWFNTKHNPFAGGILALPTGGGKTFTASRFLSIGPLSKGYKVLWLAHTHHLLEQAFSALAEELGNVSRSRSTVKLRIVSGNEDHYDIRDIKNDDDVIFVTLQTITRAYNEKSIHPNFKKFLDSTDGKLFVVFDEAQHAGAYTYYNLIKLLQEKFEKLYLIGLSATPKRNESKKGVVDGTLKELFPQGILYKISTDELIAQNILAKPVFLPAQMTQFVPDFPEDVYNKWITNDNDLPEKIITQLAKNAQRNELIADTFYKNRKKYGKTIIFADRWYQCIAIRDYINKKYHEDKSIDKTGKENIAGAIFYHVKKEYGNYESAIEDNLKVLEDFKRDKLDVIVNIRMLTEGTDVPDAHTVFLTRQTTSEILMTQMVGRVMRGPKFNGTSEALILPFIDDWKEKIMWVAPELVEGDFKPSKKEVGSVLWNYISHEVIRGIINELYQGNIEFEGYLKSYIPIGWYQTEYEGIPSSWYSNGPDETLSYNTEYYSKLKDDSSHISIKNLIMVFEDQKENYGNFIKSMEKLDLSKYQSKDVKFTENKEELSKWYNEFFSDEKEVGTDSLKKLFNIVCHIAQKGSSPVFFDFEKRDQHDIDRIAQKIRKSSLPFNRIGEKLDNEYNREDRYWNNIYHNVDDFKKHVMLRVVIEPISGNTKQKTPTIEEELVEQLNGNSNEKMDACSKLGEIGKTEALHEKTLQLLLKISQEDPDKKVQQCAIDVLNIIQSTIGPDQRKRIMERDGYKCLCCGEGRKDYLQVDHVVPRWLKLDNSDKNLQILCKFCNGAKGTKTIDFHKHKSEIEKPEVFPRINEIYSGNYPVENIETWEKFLKQKINLYYECDAVKSVKIGKRGYQLRNWEIELWDGNNPQWIEPFLNDLSKEINLVRRQKGYKGPDVIRIAK